MIAMGKLHLLVVLVIQGAPSWFDSMMMSARRYSV
jgi:hypothetical protein